MPVLEQRIVLEVVRSVKVFLNLQAGVVRGEVPNPKRSAEITTPVAGARGAIQRQGVAQLEQELEEKDRENANLRAQLLAGGEDTPVGVKPENMIWIFGAGRTGSSWLSRMMMDLEGHARWDEPYVGNIFGTAYYVNAGDRIRAREDFALGDRYREAWLNSIRNFILEGANVRFSGMAEDSYLVIKEPNGSIGAPLIMNALPESRMILLVRDPRDVVSSVLAANRKGGWGDQWRVDGSCGESLADTNPDAFVRQWANTCATILGKAEEAYEVHGGPKVVVRYEDLRYETFETMKRIYSTLKIQVDDKQLRRVIEKHAWENIPEEKKGTDKPHRKAKPGGWREDLTPKQARIIEEITAPILDEFYPGWATGTNEQ